MALGLPARPTAARFFGCYSVSCMRRRAPITRQPQEPEQKPLAREAQALAQPLPQPQPPPQLPPQPTAP